MFVARVGTGEEVIESITRQVADKNVTDASLVIIGAVKGCTISVMPKADETDDILTDYEDPFEITGTGEVVDGAVHIHVSAGGEGRTVVGHLHRAVVSHWFVRAYVTPVD
ncbi:PPC domain-containing DNA-binding protein [Dactylosporangium sp. NPDC049742]|uniref:PPC domain-containing DNA-binding protein n=1 Tax=Dactylosporangium sp. NPDC049742 TaxID=3154737 RepID=UPI00342A37DD